MVFGEFNVTLISYQNLLQETKQGQHPTLIGPLLVHEKKTKETYSLFCGALRTLKPDLANNTVAVFHSFKKERRK